jgi:hypothetical protein
VANQSASTIRQANPSAVAARSNEPATAVGKKTGATVATRSDQAACPIREVTRTTVATRSDHVLPFEPSGSGPIRTVASAIPGRVHRQAYRTLAEEKRQ